MSEAEEPKKNIVLKIGMLGDGQVGKTSMMCRYIENKFDDNYIQTLGVNFMEKQITLKNNEITFSIWDLGGQKEFSNMLPLVCNDSVALLFMFDLTRKSTLNSVKEWFRQARGFNKTAIPFLVGTKFDQFSTLSVQDQEETVAQCRKFAKAMKAPLIFTSAQNGVNVQKIFKIVLSKAFDIKCNIPAVSEQGQALIEY